MAPEVGRNVEQVEKSKPKLGRTSSRTFRGRRSRSFSSSSSDSSSSSSSSSVSSSSSSRSRSRSKQSCRRRGRYRGKQSRYSRTSDGRNSSRSSSSSSSRSSVSPVRYRSRSPYRRRWRSPSPRRYYYGGWRPAYNAYRWRRSPSPIRRSWRRYDRRSRRWSPGHRYSRSRSPYWRRRQSSYSRSKSHSLSPRRDVSKDRGSPRGSDRSRSPSVEGDLRSFSPTSRKTVLTIRNLLNS